MRPAYGRPPTALGRPLSGVPSRRDPVGSRAWPGGVRPSVAGTPASPRWGRSTPPTHWTRRISSSSRWRSTWSATTGAAQTPSSAATVPRSTHNAGATRRRPPSGTRSCCSGSGSLPVPVAGWLAAASSSPSTPSTGRWPPSRARSRRAGSWRPGATRRRSPWRRRRPTSAGPHGDANLEVLGRLTVGQVLLQEGRREEALACLDEVMLTVSTGDLYPTVAGLAYCAVIGICMGLLDVPRAQEWTSVLSDWCDAQTGLVPFRGSCLSTAARSRRCGATGPVRSRRRGERATYPAPPRETRGTSSARCIGCTGPTPRPRTPIRRPTRSGGSPSRGWP